MCQINKRLAKSDIDMLIYNVSNVINPWVSLFVSILVVRGSTFI